MVRTQYPSFEILDGFSSNNQDYVLHKLKHFKIRMCNNNSTVKADNKHHEYLSTTNKITLSLDYVYEMFEKNVPDQTYLTWALVDPLIIYWSTLTRMTSPERTGDAVTFFLSSIYGWLDVLPIPSSFARIDEESLRKDLLYLAKNIFTIQSLRRKFGTRLLDIYKGKSHLICKIFY